MPSARATSRLSRRRRDKLSEYYLLRIGFDTNNRIFLRKGVTKLGRNRNADIKVGSNYCSRTHCYITVTGDVVKIRDTNTSNGTFINEVQYRNKEKKIVVGDIIGIGCNKDASECEGNGLYHMYRLQKHTSNESVVLSDSEDDTPMLNVRLFIVHSKQI